MIRALIAREITIALRNGPVYVLTVVQVALSLLFVMIGDQVARRATPWEPPSIGTSSPAFRPGFVAAIAADVGATVMLGWIVWVFVTSIIIAPAIGGPALTRERERGLIDVLRGAGATPTVIVASKTLAAITLTVVVLLATVPSLALVFVFGNLSPDFALESGILVFGWVILGCAASVCCSAWTKTTSGSVIAASAVSLALFLILIGMPAFATTINVAAPRYVQAVSPIVAVLSVQPELGGRLIGTLPEISWLPSAAIVEGSVTPPWLPFVITSLSLAVALVFAASFGLRRWQR